MIEVRGDWKKLEAQLGEFARQVPFALATALTATAKDAQQTLKDELPKHFTMRSKWTQKGIRIQRADKRTLTAKVGSREDYMARQAKGGNKKARGKEVAVPAIGAGRPRVTQEAKTPKGKWPGAFLERKGVVILDGPKGKKKAKGIWRIKGKGDNQRLQLLYWLRKRVNVPKRWPLKETVERVVRERFVPNLEVGLEKAIATATAKAAAKAEKVG